jgi:predicted Fe-Mo cluster-binding NifX family protein
MVIVAIPSFGIGGLNEIFSQRFGRCDSFTFVTIENNEIAEVRSIENPAKDEMGGAGIKAAQFVGNSKVKDVIVGFVGPNAAQSLNALKINMLKAPDRQLTVKEALDLYINGNLSIISSSNVMNRAGAGGGRGMGRGRRGQF